MSSDMHIADWYGLWHSLTLWYCVKIYINYIFANRKNNGKLASIFFIHSIISCSTHKFKLLVIYNNIRLIMVHACSISLLSIESGDKILLLKSYIIELYMTYVIYVALKGLAKLHLHWINIYLKMKYFSYECL